LRSLQELVLGSDVGCGPRTVRAPGAAWPEARKPPRLMRSVSWSRHVFPSPPGVCSRSNDILYTDCRRRRRGHGAARVRGPKSARDDNTLAQHSKTPAGSSVLIDEQRAVRWRRKPTKQPFWANYWCGRDSRCTCRINGSKGLESDAILFFRNSSDRFLAVHVEFKHSNEAFGFGQPEAYPLRAACFAKTHHARRTLNAHDDWTTVVFCGAESLSDQRLSHFQRVITHGEAARVIRAYPIAVLP
jgi:hypothetical protein